MIHELTIRQRELELVSLMLNERQVFYEEYRRATGKDPAFAFDRDIVREILAIEYSDQSERRVSTA
jgi:hypothetical protein